MKNKEITPNMFIEKIVVNTGVGRLGQQQNFEKILVEIKRQLSEITGQTPQVRRLRRSIAGFKAREGQIVGLRITLRGRKKVDFFLRLITIVLPRVRDFRGISLESLDASGMLNFGLREQFVFPEIRGEDSSITFPLGINIVPYIRNRDEAFDGFRSLGVPFKKRGRE